MYSLKRLKALPIILTVLVALAFTILNVSIFTVQASVAFSNRLKSVELAALDERTFVVFYCDAVEDDWTFKIFDTNGTEVLGAVDIETNMESSHVDYHGCDVVVFNSTTFALLYSNYTRHTTVEEYGVWMQVYNRTGTQLVGPTIITYHIEDTSTIDASISGSAFNSTFLVILWNNDANDDLTFAIYMSNGTQVVGETDIDANMGDNCYFNGVTCFNSTHFAVAAPDYESGVNDLHTWIVNVTGSILYGPTDIDASVTSPNPCPISALNSTAYTITYIDGDDTWLAVYDSTNTQLLAPTKVDDDLKSITGTPRGQSCAVLNSSVLVTGWRDEEDSPDTVNFHTLWSNGSSISGETEVAALGSFPADADYQALCSEEAATGIGIYNDCFIYAWGNYTGGARAGVWAAYMVNGTSWDGIIPEEEFSASITVNTSTHSWNIIPGQSDVLINEGSISITVTSNKPYDIQVKGSGDLAFGSYTISLSNVKVHEDTLESAVSLTTDYADVVGLTNLPAGTDVGHTFKLWLSCPTGKPAGTYAYTLSIQVIEYT